MIKDLAILVCLAIAGYFIYDKLYDRPVGSDSVVARQAPAVKKQPTKQVTIKAPVTAFVGKTKANLKYSGKFLEDDNEQVIAANQVKGSDRPQTVSTVVNTETGAVTTFVKTDPYPWLSFEPRGELKLSYGYKFKAALPQAERVTRLQLNYDVIRVKALTVGATATIDTDRDAFVGASVSYRW